MAEKKLTDAQLKSKIIAGAHKKASKVDQSESLFPTEIIPLPSRGLVYPVDNPLSSGELELRYMTGKDEDILTNPNYLKKGIALDKLYEALVVSNGKGEPVNLNDIVVGDRSAIMLAARVLGYGSDYTITLKHPETGKEFTTTVDINKLKVKELDYDIYNNSRTYEYVLPVSKKKIVFNLSTAVEQKRIEKTLAAQEKAGIPPKRTTTELKNTIVSVDGNDDKNFINDFVENYLLAKDSLHLRKHILDITPDFDLTIEVEVPEEDYHEFINLPIDINFFWPRL